MNVYAEDFVVSEPLIKGNIQFRLGWALIRLNSIDQGIAFLTEADKNLVDNSDVKVKLAQILVQEKNDTKKSTKLIKEALEIDEGNVEALLLQGKM